MFDLSRCIQYIDKNAAHAQYNTMLSLRFNSHVLSQAKHSLSQSMYNIST